MRKTFWWLVLSQIFPIIGLISCIFNERSLAEGYKTGLAINGLFIEIYLFWQLAINLNELNK